MTSPVTLKQATDVWVSSKRAKNNHSGAARLRVSSGGDGNNQQAFIFFALPFPKGATVLNAKFRLTNSNLINESTTITVSRVVDRWKAGKVNWDNKPSITNTDSVSVTKTVAPSHTVWEFDIGAMMETVSDLGNWWGLKITCSTQAPKLFYSANANSVHKPELEIAWSEAPEAPEELSPGGGRAVPNNTPLLTFDFVDNAGNEELNACEVQFSSTDDTSFSDNSFTSVTWNSGVVPVSEAELPLAGRTTLANDVLTYWQVRVQDGAGLWSEWSDPEAMIYIAKKPVTILSPGAAPNNFVTDITPPILWSFGGNQVHYKVILSTADEPNDILWTSGKTTDSDNGITIPKGYLKSQSITYRIRVLVWDDVDREKNGIDPIYSEATQDFNFVDSATITRVNNVVAVQDQPWPWVNVYFKRDTAADEYTISRDDEVIAFNVPADELIQPSGDYLFVDRMASPRVSHTWDVQAVVNGNTSKKQSSNPLKTRLLTTMMMELDGTDPMYFMNPAVDPQSMTFQEMHQPMQAPPVLITQYMGGYEGHFEGLLVDDILPGTSARNMRNKFKQWKKNPGTAYYLYLIDEVLKIVPYNMTYKPEAKGGNIVRYKVSFDFFEVD